MSKVFLKILNMGISASWLILAILLLRLVLKRAPKWIRVLLWGMVAVRLICPVTLQSVLSLIPSRETVSPGILLDPTPQITTGIEVLDNAVNPVISGSFAPAPLVSANPLQILVPVAANFWLLGIAAMLGYMILSYWRLRRRVATAICLRGTVYQSEYVDSPFVLGLLRPRIYVPFSVDARTLEYVVAHESAHIRRKDHWWKPMGFLLLSVYRWNPLMWLGYVLLCRDIELACDEKVIGKMENESRADYTQALVCCSKDRRRIAACPLAFGEVGVKERVKSVMNYKKPGFWILLLSVLACIGAAVCFLTDPKEPEKDTFSVSQVGGADAPEATTQPTEPSDPTEEATQPPEQTETAYSIDEAISKAILERNKGDRFLDIPSGTVNVESHFLFGVETVSGTPLAGQTNHIEETKVYILYAYTRYDCSSGVPEPVAGTCTPAAITFTGNSDEGYTWREFWEPHPGETGDREVREQFPEKIADAVLDENTDGYNAGELQSRCLSQAEATLETGMAHGMPVAWIYEPGAEGNYGFRFFVEIPYTKLTVSCDQGSLVDAESNTNQAIAKELTLTTERGVYWSPMEKEGFHKETNLEFTLYDGETAVYSGRITLTGRAYGTGIYAYVATLDGDGLYLDMNNETPGAVITLVEE